VTVPSKSSASEPRVEFSGPRGEQTLALHAGLSRVTIGRGPGNDISLGWDTTVSRVHAELERRGDRWTVVDEGQSRAGTFVNGKQIEGRQALKPGDVLRVGETELKFRVGKPEAVAPRLSPTQLRVLESFCRPVRETQFARPAADEQIAEELFISSEAVRAHLRALAAAFGVSDRGELARAALRAGLGG
jgi:pSer/pThr/pTyr-binding forkhead associated (FHA) protein